MNGAIAGQSWRRPRLLAAVTCMLCLLEGCSVVEVRRNVSDPGCSGAASLALAARLSQVGEAVPSPDGGTTPEPTSPVNPGISGITPDSIPSLRTWLRGDGGNQQATTAGFVSSWTDMSGMAFHATQGTGANQPALISADSSFNGRAVLSFDGVNDQLRLNRPVQDDFTIVIVFRSAGGQSIGGEWFFCAGMLDGEVGGTVNDFGLSLNVDGRVGAGTGQNGWADFHMTSQKGLNDNSGHIVVWQRNRTARFQNFHIDGVFRAEQPGSNASLTSPAQLTLGSLQLNSNYLAVRIAEIVIYGAQLSDANRIGLECHLAVKYGLTVSQQCAP